MDTGPGWDVLTVNAIFASDEVLAPVSLEPLALMGLADFARSLEKVQRYHQAPLRWVLPTFADRRRRQTGELLEQLRAHYGDRVCDPIRATVRLSECAASGNTWPLWAVLGAGLGYCIGAVVDTSNAFTYAIVLGLVGLVIGLIVVTPRQVKKVKASYAPAYYSPASFQTPSRASAVRRTASSAATFRSRLLKGSTITGPL